MLFPRRGFMSTRRVAKRLWRSLRDAHFSDLVRPLRVVATQLETCQRVVFSSGEVARAVEASFAIPGICVPVEIDGEVYVDGGVADPLPVDVLEEMGIERIIAVNVIPRAGEAAVLAEPAARGETATPRRWSPWRWLNQQLNFFAQGNVFDNMIQAFIGAQTVVADASTRRADVALRPGRFRRALVRFHASRQVYRARPGRRRGATPRDARAHATVSR